MRILSLLAQRNRNRYSTLMENSPSVRNALGLGALVVLICLNIFVYFCQSPAKKDLRVTFLDVGQGDAVLVEAPNGNTLLYDAGPGTVILPKLGEELGFLGRTIDVAVSSHPDADHIGGFPEVIRRYHIDLMLVSGASSSNPIDEEAERAITETGVHRFVAHQGQRINLGGGVVADVLYPAGDTSHMETNDASIVLRIAYGKTSFLLTGDLPSNFEQVIAGQYGDQASSTVLKLGHHGSRTSSDPLFLRAIHPEFVVVSAGKENRYGHPHKEVVAEVAQLGIPLYRTDLQGNITFLSDGTQVNVETDRE